MALYVIADLHLSLGADKPMDVFPGWKDYVQRLERHWRETVSPEDTVVVAGDISWAMKLEEGERDFAFLHSLPGEKLLLKGNHDYWWSTRSKIDAFFQEKGFSSLHILHNCAYRVGDVAVCGTRGWLYNSESAEDKKIVAREAGRLLASLADGEKQGGGLWCFSTTRRCTTRWSAGSFWTSWRRRGSPTAISATSTASTPPGRPWWESAGGCGCT